MNCGTACQFCEQFSVVFWLFHRVDLSWVDLDDSLQIDTKPPFLNRGFFFNIFLFLGILNLLLLVLSVDLARRIGTLHFFDKVFIFELGPKEVSLFAIVGDGPPKSFTDDRLNQVGVVPLSDKKSEFFEVLFDFFNAIQSQDATDE